MSQARERQSNIELLRILATCAVVILHYNNAGIGKAMTFVEPGTASGVLIYLLEAISVNAVNLFMLISGYFRYGKRKVYLARPLQLLAEVSLITLGYYIYLILSIHGTFTPQAFILNLLPRNYFVITYVTVYILSPYVSLLLEKLDDRQAYKFLAIAMILFSFWPTLLQQMSRTVSVDLYTMSTIMRDGTASGYSFINYMLLFMIGCILHKVQPAVKLKTWLLLLIADVAALFTWLYYCWTHGTSLGVGLAYCNPLVVGSAAFIFMVFLNITMQPNRVINRLSAAAFTVYLTHINLIRAIPIEPYAKKGVLVLALHIMLTVFICYLNGFLVHQPVTFLLKHIQTKRPFIDLTEHVS